jgi:hypothetical protein
MFYMVNGCNLHVDASDVLRLTTDAAEGQIGVQDVAATLKDWAQPFPVADDWMDTPPDLSAGSGEDIEDHVREIEQNLETQVAEWAEEWNQKAVEADAKFRQGLADFRDSQIEMAEVMAEFVAEGQPIPEADLQRLRQMRQKALNIRPDMPPEWAEWVNSSPAFVLLDIYEQHRFPTGERHRSSPRRRTKRKRRRR